MSRETRDYIRLQQTGLDTLKFKMEMKRSTTPNPTITMAAGGKEDEEKVVSKEEEYPLTFEEDNSDYNDYAQDESDYNATLNPGHYEC